MELKDIKISYEDGRYTAVYKDELGSLVTDGRTLDELFERLKEAFELHFSDTKISATIDFSKFKLNLTTFARRHATHLQAY